MQTLQLFFQRWSNTLIYTLEVEVLLPKLKYQYRDGDYYNFLKQSLSHDEYLLLEFEVKRIRKENIKFYRRFYTKSLCLNEYVAYTEKDRTEIRNTISKFLTEDKFQVSYKENEYNYSIKEYIFLQ